MSEKTSMITAQKCANTLESFRTCQIGIIGDIMLDRFVYGHAERLSPESPVPVLAIKREDTMIGGAGNVLTNLGGLGVHTCIFGVLGNDLEAQEIKKLSKRLVRSNTDLTFITDKNRPTTVKTRFLAGHQQLLRTDAEDRTPIPAPITDDIIVAFKEKAEALDCIVLSDYGKGLLTETTIKTLIKIAKKTNTPVIVDPKGTDFFKYKGAFAVTPNKKELHEATRMPVETDEDIEAAADHIIKAYGIETVIATRGPQGISVIQKNKPHVHLPTPPVDVFDVSGAGDTVIATIAACVAAGADLAQAAALANIAGGIVVAKVGTATIRLDEMQSALSDPETLSGSIIEKTPAQTSRAPSAHHFTAEHVLEDIKRWRAKGLKIGFTNGCFDILHQGHVTYLQETRKHCDRLIVGLNSDSSVRILKGETRPVHDETSRAIVLAGLGCVDRVTFFGAKNPGDDNTACALLNTLKPDVYFKGGDYTIDQIPETPTVQAYGGEVKVLSEVKGHSTTASLAKLQEDESA